MIEKDVARQDMLGRTRANPVSSCKSCQKKTRAQIIDISVHSRPFAVQKAMQI